ncbi:MAG: SufD family Fe-S cluster assembly protein, partial [Armatimonadota bacterium]
MNIRPTTYDFSLADLIPAATGPAWLTDLKSKAVETHRKLGIPTPATEEWKYTPLRQLGATQFKKASFTGAVELPAAHEGSIRVVLVDGIFRADLSTLLDVEGLVVTSVASAIDQGCEVTKNHLGAAARIDEHTFAALNTAIFTDGVLVFLKRGAMVEPLIEIVHVAATPQAVSTPRVLIVAEEGSSARIVETYLSSSSETLSLPVTECFIAKDANVEHVRVQDEDLSSHHIALWQVRQEGSSEYRSYNICFGSALGRVDQSIWLGGSHVTTRLDGVVIGKGT